MQRRRFGKTEMNLSVLSFGAMRIVPEKDETEADARERAYATMRRALDVGINHIETARGYGLSEQIIGSALKDGRIRRDEFYLTTKIGPNASGDEFRKALDDSMGRMGVNFVDNLDIHGINTRELLDTTMAPGACMDAAERAVAEGIVGHLGFSTHGPLDVILDALRTGRFQSINLHYYYINTRNRPAVELANEMDMGVFIISPTDKGGQLFKPSGRLVELCKPWTPIEMNQRWLLAQPGVHTLSLGCERPSDFDAHLAMANRAHGPLTAEEQAVFDRMAAAVAGIGESYCNFCHACLPCPEDVHIPEILRLRNLVQAFDMREFGKYRYKMFAHKDAQTGERMGGASHWFPGADAAFCTDCDDCLPRCPLNLPIPTLLRETHEALSGDVGKRLWED
ncbi:MAG TPA: aldo/keto reductase [Chthonomonadaceae bacterium]|nr:aldo/keto reductase [Chthonomonadaceae bacterium]